MKKTGNARPDARSPGYQDTLDMLGRELIEFGSKIAAIKKTAKEELNRYKPEGGYSLVATIDAYARSAQAYFGNLKNDQKQKYEKEMRLLADVTELLAMRYERFGEEEEVFLPHDIALLVSDIREITKDRTGVIDEDEIYCLLLSDDGRKKSNKNALGAGETVGVIEDSRVLERRELERQDGRAKFERAMEFLRREGYFKNLEIQKRNDKADGGNKTGSEVGDTSPDGILND